MPDFEGKRLEIYEKYIDDIEKNTDLSHGDYVFPSFTRTVAVDDGYREADYILELTIANEIEKEIVLMISNIHDDDRKILKDINDDEAFTRARKYAAELEKGAYYGITDGEKVKISAIDPEFKLEETKEIHNLHEIIDEIIKEERRIKRSEDFVSNLKEYNEKINPDVHSYLRKKIEEDESFEEEIRNFLTPIGMSYEKDEKIPDETLEMLSRQATYLLIDKILFYYLILENEENLKDGVEERERYDEIFEELDEEPPKPSDDTDEWADVFWGYLTQIFELIREIDYEPIFDPEKSPLNKIDLKEHPSACFEIKDLMDFLWKKEELSNLFDGPLLAKIYEGLIPPKLRWKWGQIYTPPEVTRLIAEWAIRNPNDRVLDPACGTGRFLISAYEKLAELKGVEIGEKHQEIISQIYGIDINQFPAHLATMSLVAMSLESVTEDVNIEVKDFFNYLGGSQSNLGLQDDKVRTQKNSTMSSDDFEKPLGNMDAIIMNPPYTRVEGLDNSYKRDVRNIALNKVNDKNNIKMSKGAGFYTYFITHGLNFLKKSGRFGMIIQNSWLDVKFGKDVQDFLLSNFKIKAIIATQNDRLIKTAEVNTVIVLLEKEEDEKAKKQNKVKFVKLKNRLDWFEENYELDELLSIINEKENYLHKDLRIVSKKQEELEDTHKWGRFIRAPDIFFDKVEDVLNKKLDDFVKVKLGLTSGYNNFFYLKKEKIDELGIEDKYLETLVKSPRNCKKYILDPNDLNMWVLNISEDRENIKNTNAFEYIKSGEEKGIHKRPFFENKSKENWYKQDLIQSELLQPYNVGSRHFACLNKEDVCIDKALVCMDVKSEILPVIWSYLNSTIGILIKELYGRTMYGEGALDNTVTDTREFPIFDVEEFSENYKKEFESILDEMGDKKIGNVFDEIGTEDPNEVSLNKVNEPRRKLDKIVMEEIMDLSKKEQVEIYRAVIELLNDRIQKAKSGN